MNLPLFLWAGLLVSPSVAAPVSRQASSGAITISTGGQVGGLSIDRSERNAVLASAGNPEAEGTGNFGANDPDYQALGYSCTSHEGRGVFPVGNHSAPYSYCRTVYFINEKTLRLAALFTSSAMYLGSHGIHPAMPAALAERRTHKQAIAGCEQGFWLGTKSSRALLFVAVEGGRTVSHNLGNGNTLLVLNGGRIGSFSLESKRHPVGLEFC